MYYRKANYFYIFTVNDLLLLFNIFIILNYFSKN
jgi:hypothetical protein